MPAAAIAIISFMDGSLSSAYSVALINLCVMPRCPPATGRSGLPWHHSARLEGRIKVLHEELDVVVAKYVDERAAQVPGVHRGSVEGSKM